MLFDHDLAGRKRLFEDIDRSTRIGLAGFSVGGALSIVAAADPRIRDDVRLVYSFGGYYDAFGVLRFGSGWADTLARMQRWLARGERLAACPPDSLRFRLDSRFRHGVQIR